MKLDKIRKALEFVATLPFEDDLAAAALAELDAVEVWMVEPFSVAKEKAAAAEREACAGIASEHECVDDPDGGEFSDKMYCCCSEVIARRIRARGEK